jgi:hypothetical protein
VFLLHRFGAENLLSHKPKSENICQIKEAVEEEEAMKPLILLDVPNIAYIVKVNYCMTETQKN